MRNLIALAVALGTLSGAAFGAELAPMRPLTETPDVTATPGRELEERRLAAELRIWQSRIADAERLLGSDHAEVRALRRSYRVAQQNWQKLKQTTGPNWETQRTMFHAAMDQLRRQWAEVAEARDR